MISSQHRAKQRRERTQRRKERERATEESPSAMALRTGGSDRSGRADGVGGGGRVVSEGTLATVSTACHAAHGAAVSTNAPSSQMA